MSIATDDFRGHLLVFPLANQHRASLSAITNSDGMEIGTLL